jgi:hypothetical protein
MSRKQQARSQAEPEALYDEAVSLLDRLHGTLTELAGAVGELNEVPLEHGEGSKWPRAQFVVDGSEPPERGGLALDTRLTICLTLDQAETLLSELASGVREQEKEIEIDLDGRLSFRRDATRELQAAIEEQD